MINAYLILAYWALVIVFFIAVALGSAPVAILTAIALIVTYAALWRRLSSER